MKINCWDIVEQLQSLGKRYPHYWHLLGTHKENAIYQSKRDTFFELYGKKWPRGCFKTGRPSAVYTNSCSFFFFEKKDITIKENYIMIFHFCSHILLMLTFLSHLPEMLWKLDPTYIPTLWCYWSILFPSSEHRLGISIGLRGWYELYLVFVIGMSYWRNPRNGSLKLSFSEKRWWILMGGYGFCYFEFKNKATTLHKTFNE